MHFRRKVTSDGMCAMCHARVPWGVGTLYTEARGTVTLATATATGPSGTTEGYNRHIAEY